MLLEVAEVNDLQVKKIDPSQAILLGYSLALQQRVIVTYTTSHGLKVWYWHENLQNVNDPDLVQKTMQYLTDIAKKEV